MYAQIASIGNLKAFEVLKFFLMFMLFFPSITFGIFGDHVEMFPWGVLFGLLFVNRIFTQLILFTLFLTPWLLYLIFTDVYNFEAYRSLASYLNPIIVLFVILEFREKEINQLYFCLKISFFVCIFIGIFQFYFDIYLLETLSQFLTPRTAVSPDNVGVTQRGVSVLSSEHSRSAIELVLLSSVIICYEKNIKNYVYWFFLFLIFYLFFINKSLSSFLFVFVLFISYLFVINKLNYKTILWLVTFQILIISTLIISINYLPAEIYNSTRILAVFKDLSGQPLDQLFLKIYEHSGLRGSSQMAIYLEPKLFGNGLGEAKQAVRDGIAKNEFLKCCLGNWYSHNVDVITRHRPSSFLAVTVSELGLVGGFCLFYYLFYIIKLKNKGISLVNNKIFLISASLFTILFLGTTGSPIPFIVMAMILNFKLIKQT